jgi:hypothetical protein
MAALGSDSGTALVASLASGADPRAAYVLAPSALKNPTTQSLIGAAAGGGEFADLWRRVCATLGRPHKRIAQTVTAGRPSNG